jgi:hypothetical protein
VLAVLVILSVVYAVLNMVVGGNPYFTLDAINFAIFSIWIFVFCWIIAGIGYAISKLGLTKFRMSSTGLIKTFVVATGLTTLLLGWTIYTEVVEKDAIGRACKANPKASGC